MTKVVINACFGGFSLSAVGEAAYLARKGKQAFFYVEDRESGKRPGDRDYVRVSPAEARQAFMATTLTVDLGKRITHEEMWPGGNGHKGYVGLREIERDDPDLVAVVEAIGDEASGSCAKLVVVEIPDDANWQIEEYDGSEHVAEQHRTWYS